MAWLHTWCGLVLSLILYFVFITGTFGYFNSEIDYWMQPKAPGDIGGADDAELLRRGFDYLRGEVPDATRHFVALPGDRAAGAAARHGRRRRAVPYALRAALYAL